MRRWCSDNWQGSTWVLGEKPHWRHISDEMVVTSKTKSRIAIRLRKWVSRLNRIKIAEERVRLIERHSAVRINTSVRPTQKQTIISYSWRINYCPGRPGCWINPLRVVLEEPRKFKKFLTAWVDKELNAVMYFIAACLVRLALRESKTTRQRHILYHITRLYSGNK